MCRVLLHYVGVVQARRTYTNHTLPELTVCRVLLHSFGVVQAQRTSSNLHEPHPHSEQGVKGTRAGLLKHLEPHRTYRKHTTTELALCVGCFCTHSGWFKHIEPTRTKVVVRWDRMGWVQRHSSAILPRPTVSSFPSYFTLIILPSLTQAILPPHPTNPTG